MVIPMPDVVVHTVFGQDVLKKLPPEVRQEILPDPYRFALYGPDPWFAYQPGAHREGRGRRMHTTRTGDFLTALAIRAREGSARREMYSYLAGFLCHYALDAATHPYIIRRTTTDFTTPRAHMGFEHRLDVLEMERAGTASEKHPVTRRFFRPVSLPKVMEADLNQVYESIYGWKNCFRILNRSIRIFRLFFRVMESPSGIPARLARRRKQAYGLRALTYTVTDFADADPENRKHSEWAHSHDESILSRESFPELKEKALKRAVELIQAAYRYIYTDGFPLEALREQIGNDSYLSGLPVDDPRCLTVDSMLPPAGSAEANGTGPEKSAP